MRRSPNQRIRCGFVAGLNAEANNPSGFTSKLVVCWCVRNRFSARDEKSARAAVRAPALPSERCTASGAFRSQRARLALEIHKAAISQRGRNLSTDMCAKTWKLHGSGDGRRSCPSLLVRMTEVWQLSARLSRRAADSGHDPFKSFLKFPVQPISITCGALRETKDIGFTLLGADRELAGELANATGATDSNVH